MSTWRGTLIVTKSYDCVEVEADNEEEAELAMQKLTEKELSNFTCDETAEVEDLESLDDEEESDED